MHKPHYDTISNRFNGSLASSPTKVSLAANMPTKIYDVHVGLDFVKLEHLFRR
jgi:hypothetical protein